MGGGGVAKATLALFCDIQAAGSSHALAASSGLHMQQAFTPTGLR